MSEILCPIATDQCHYGDYRSCSNRYSTAFLRNCLSDDEDEIMGWTNWKRTNKRVTLQQVVGKVTLLLAYIDEQWVDPLLYYHYNKMQQSYTAIIKKVRILPWLKHIETYLLSFSSSTNRCGIQMML